MVGCNGKVEQEQTIRANTEPGTVSTGAPVTLEARIVEVHACRKYCYYDIKVIKVIKNSIEVKLDSRVKVARVSYETQPELNKTYILDLDYYNKAHPEYGLKIVSFKGK